MKECFEFLKKCGTYYLATVDEQNGARVRPFGTIDIFDGHLMIQSGRSKDVSKQIMANPQIEICAFDGKEWLRIHAVAKEDPRIEAQQHMLDAYPSLAGMYKAGDGNTIVFALESGVATFSSFTSAPRTIEF
ncbi:MAG: pyridoxamine 5'-phosphate oxidase family protein [Clostridia bacterium]|nr:pyridoxamine 5'-phosphate oxidase family protein [Clostridia bacterium]